MWWIVNRTSFMTGAPQKGRAYSTPRTALASPARERGRVREAYVVTRRETKRSAPLRLPSPACGRPLPQRRMTSVRALRQPVVDRRRHFALRAARHIDADMAALERKLRVVLRADVIAEHARG